MPKEATPENGRSSVPLDKIVSLLAGSEFEGCVFSHSGKPWLRYDIDDCDPKEQWDEYCDVLDGLKRFGLGLEDAQVEHDCISGDIIYLEG